MKELAEKITDAIFHHDPYNGADREDVLQATEDLLWNVGGRLTLIESLADMLLEE